MQAKLNPPFKLGDRVFWSEDLLASWGVVISVDKDAVVVGSHRWSKSGDTFTRRKDGAYRLRHYHTRCTLWRVTARESQTLVRRDDYLEQARRARDERRQLAARAYEYTAQCLRRLVTERHKYTLSEAIEREAALITEVEDDPSLLLHDVARCALVALSAELAELDAALDADQAATP